MVTLTREQLEEQLAALHLASLELVRDLSLETVLERIAILAKEFANARYTALGVFTESGELEKFIPVGMTEDEIAQIDHKPEGKGLLGIFNSDDSHTPIRISEISEHKMSVGFPDGHPKMHSFLSVPIMLGNQLLGQLYLTDKINYPEFTERDERAIETLAAYAAVAINNARLYNEIIKRDKELVQRNEDLKLLNEVAVTLANTKSEDEILDRTLIIVLDYLKTDSAEIYLREEGEKSLRLALHRGEFADTFSYRDRFRVGESCIGTVAETGEPIVIEDLKKDFTYLRPEVIKAGFTCMACIPLKTGNKVIGVLVTASKKPVKCDERQLKLLSAIANWAGITIENARLNKQSRRLAVLEERERIGMDLHDGIIQSIYGVGLTLDFARMSITDDPDTVVQKIDEAIDNLNKTIRDIRAYILDLRPRQFIGNDLKQGLQRLVDEFQANSGTKASLICMEDNLVDFPAANATALFHICQEALANVAKHAEAKQVTIHLWTAKDRVILEIGDDGKGFDLRKMSVTLGHGLSNMHFRARKVGGDVEFTSYPSQGTTVLAWVPRTAS